MLCTYIITVVLWLLSVVQLEQQVTRMQSQYRNLILNYFKCFLTLVNTIMVTPAVV